MKFLEGEVLKVDDKYAARIEGVKINIGNLGLTCKFKVSIGRIMPCGCFKPYSRKYLYQIGKRSKTIKPAPAGRGIRKAITHIWNIQINWDKLKGECK